MAIMLLKTFNFFALGVWLFVELTYVASDYLADLEMERDSDDRAR